MSESNNGTKVGVSEKRERGRPEKAMLVKLKDKRTDIQELRLERGT